MDVLKVLARGITAITALVALAAAGPALGGNPPSTSFSAQLEFDDRPEEPDGTIEFVLDEGNKRKVHDIAITDMKANCGGNAGELDFHIYGNTKVLDNRSFAVRSEDGEGAKAIVRGRFSRKFKSAKGTVRLHGKFPVGAGGERTKCETGKQEFKATVTGSTAARGGNDLEIKFILSSTPQGKPVQIKDFKFKHFTVVCAVGGPSRSTVNWEAT